MHAEIRAVLDKLSESDFEEEDREQLRALFGVRDLQLAGVHGNIENFIRLGK